MHTSSLSGTITTAIYSDIFLWGILEHKQRYFECAYVCVYLLWEVIKSVPSNQTEIELNWLSAVAVVTGGQQWILGDRRKKQKTLTYRGTHFPNMASPSVKLYLEITASICPPLLSAALLSHHFISGKISDLSLLLSTLFTSPWSDRTHRTHNVRGQVRVVICNQC